MSIATLAQNSFTGGEWSPRLYGRTDLQKYASACSVLENMTIMPHGAIQRRMGTEMVCAALSEDVVLIPFIFNVEQAYVLECTPKKMRFFRDGGLLEKTLTTPWDAAALKKLAWTQSADVLYLVCDSVQPYKLIRSGTDVFSLAAVGFSGQPGDWGTDSWPRAVTFHQQRLWFAGTKKKPQTLWASKLGEFENLGTGTDDSSGLAITLASNEVNAIHWLMSTRNLLIGTSGGEWVVSASDTDGGITTKNVQARRNSNYGTGAVPPLMVGTTVLHTSNDRTRVRELGYSLADDGYISTDLSLLGEHITKGRVRRMAYAPDPDGIVWCVMDDGSFAGCTYLRSHEVVGWHRHPMDGKVVSVAVIPEDMGSETWLVVKRASQVCIERLKPSWDGENTNESGAWYVDCGLQYSGAATTKVRGLEHLEGQKVSVLADGARHRDLFVSQGSIELDSPASLVTVGLPYMWRMAPMFPEGASNNGTAQGKKKRVASVTVRVYKSMGLQYGVFPDTQELFDVANRDVSDSMGKAPTPYTGDWEILLPEQWGRDGRYVLCGNLPFPVTLVLAVPKVVVYE